MTLSIETAITTIAEEAARKTAAEIARATVREELIRLVGIPNNLLKRPTPVLPEPDAIEPPSDPLADIQSF